ncbi:FMN-binding negative transcriptional regulator [Sphingomonas sp. ID1715]|uniref:FMN-binding negative transcriptional regulator n=1 Tax=Sphingomonas sp. ID1715 TaxID=1656898 RepID=UPI00148815B5|nr:FMN-binding negative transcriptional regulator [Sphingomonas sp. ID1715]NNM76957.1 FMN-binding negative transcriptional regulator [Sphingomonas sp. ID1715]
MHPNRAFHGQDDEEGLALAERLAFAHIFAVPEGRPMVVHAPIVRASKRAFRFHLARGNRMTQHLDGATVLLSLVGAQGYITPNWYAQPPDQVPTWNYIAVELDGTARLLPDEALIEQLDRLAEVHEPGLSPAPWTRGKMAPAKFEAMHRAIAGFEVEIDSVRVTRKLSQNKPDQDRAGVIAGLIASGNLSLAQAMRVA